MIVKQDAPGVTVRGLCRLAGFSRQAYYKEKKARRRQAVDAEAIVKQVQEQRAVHVKMGGRKLLGKIGGALKGKGISIGRDRLFGLLRYRKLLVVRRRAGSRTTDSRHGLGVYPYRIRHIVASLPDQVWVCDLTYIDTDEGFVYLALITDVYSRKIVGWNVRDYLETEGCLGALRMALKGLREGARPIHHSDQGSQYCSGVYVKLLASRGLESSMTKWNHCYENAKAERVNGILKQEYGLGERFKTRDQAKVAAPEAVRIYNDLRPHMALAYRTPSSVYSGRGEGEEASETPGGEKPGESSPPASPPPVENTLEVQGDTL
jgi:transposase InsO family protein